MPTLVLTWVYRPWVMHHVDTPTTLPELTSLKQPRWSAISVSPYAASISDRPKEPVVLRNHHPKSKTSSYASNSIDQVHKPPRGLFKIKLLSSTNFIFRKHYFSFNSIHRLFKRKQYLLYHNAYLWD